MKRRFPVIVCAILACCVIGISLYEPKNCPLCYAEPSDVPCLVDLHTGEIGEIKIGKRELSDDPATFAFYFVEVAGCKGYCDTASRCCQITLEQGERVMNPFLYCHSCRAKLRELRHDRYAVLDLRHTETATVYSAACGEFDIGKYHIEIADDGTSIVLLSKLP